MRISASSRDERWAWTCQYGFTRALVLWKLLARRSRNLGSQSPLHSRIGKLMQCLKNAEVTPVFVADESSNLTKSGEDARRQAKADTALLEPRAHRSLPVPTGDAAYHTKLSKLTVAAAKRITEDLMADVMRYVVSEGGCG